MQSERREMGVKTGEEKRERRGGWGNEDGGEKKGGERREVGRGDDVEGEGKTELLAGEGRVIDKA